MKLLFFLVSFSHILFGCRAQDFPLIVPAVQSVTLADGDPFELLRSLDIVIDPRSAEVRDTDGLTLVPPSTGDFAQTFADDLHALFPSTSVSLYVGSSAPQGGIFVATGGCNFTLADGALTSEGYSLNISSNGVIIVGSGARGVFWASRTLLQGLLLNNGSLPASLVRDGPSWETRGFMLDAGRQWYPIKFLTEICAYASWFKASEFHVHLSDNVNPGNDPNATYARFRLRPTDPSLQGLTPHINETYSMEEFEDFQNACAVRGVTVIPEIESPGHALVITQWKPELALLTDATLINLTVPESIPTIKSIWQEFLPIIHTKQVSIGADEYDSDLADNYNDFVNEMSTFMAEFNKTIRIWGTNEPSNKTSVSRDITIQHWEFFEDDPFSLIERGYSVINSDDAFMYIVMKFSGSYPQALNQTRIWDGANIRNGGAWDPHIFDRGNASNNPMVSDSLLQGAISATWNDHGPTASTYLEAFYAMKYGIPAVMANAWSPGKLNQRQFNNSIAELVASAPGQNLARHIAHHGHVVVDYTLSAGSNTVQDASGNGFDADVQENHIKTPLGSFGPPYTFRILASNTSDSASRTLLTGPDDTFLIDSSTLAFVSSNITYLLPNFTLTTSWKEIVIGATEIGTHAFVDGSVAGEFRVVIDGTAVTVPLTFVAPLAMIDAAIERFTLWDEMVDIADIHKLA